MSLWSWLARRQPQPTKADLARDKRQLARTEAQTSEVMNIAEKLRAAREENRLAARIEAALKGH